MSSGTTSSLGTLGEKWHEKASSTRKMLWKHRDGEKHTQKKGNENPSRLNNVGNLLRGMGANRERLCFFIRRIYVEHNGTYWDGVSLYYYSVHISHQASPFLPLCVAFALDFFHFRKKSIKHTAQRKKKSREMGKSAIMMCIRKWGAERGKAGGEWT